MKIDKEFRRKSVNVALLCTPFLIFGIAAVHDFSRNNRTRDFNYQMMPQSVRPYDLHRDGFIDYKEAQGLTNLILRASDTAGKRL